MSKIGKLIMEWDECKIIEDEIKFQLEESKEEIEMGETTEESIRNSAYNDSYVMEINLNSFIEDLTTIMNKKCKTNCWKVEISNFGWKNQNGNKVFKADDARELINNLLPNTPCTYKIYNYSNGLAIQNFHHDSPTGNEWYYLKPIAESTYEKMR